MILSEQFIPVTFQLKGGGKFSLTGYRYQYIQMLMCYYIISPTNSQSDIIYNNLLKVFKFSMSSQHINKVPRKTGLP